jgi:hypothetical protein
VSTQIGLSGDVRTGRSTAPRPLVPEPTAPRRRVFGPGWPMSALFLGFPIWWAVGLPNFILPMLVVPMAVQLVRQAPIRLPRGFITWLLFLVWVLAGFFTLQLDAPGAIAGAGGSGRIMTWGFRLVLYISVTIVLLYVGNSSERDLSTLRVCRLLGYMFVVTAFGGVLGMLAPHFQFVSPVEALLPHAARANAFIDSLVHPKSAEVQTILGYAEARPIAPFTYANSWGANFSLYLPFFLYTWLGPTAGWRRKVAPLILLIALAPAIYSLNRGLWGAVAVGIAYVAIRLALKGRIWALQGIILAGLVLALVFVLSPLSSIVQERLAHPHSNARRGSLASLTIDSTLGGSPVFGYGTTRNLQGSFASIAGGATVQCGGCGVPPLGTQGEMWSIIFFNGIGGAGLFIAFFVYRFFRHWRDPSPLAIAGCVTLLMSAVEWFVYDFSGMPMTTMMIAIALMWRSERHGAHAGARP